MLLFLYPFAAMGVPKVMPLRYDDQLAAQGFTSPIVDVYVNGKRGLFLIDTGASVNVVSKFFAEQTKIVIGVQAGVGGSSGGSSRSSVGKVDFIVGGPRNSEITFKDQYVAIVSLPDTFKENGISGIISPQQLLGDRETGILSLSQNPSFKIYDKTPALKGPSFNLDIASALGPAGEKTALFTINANVAGMNAKFIVDTGANGTGLGLKTHAGKRLLPQSIPTSEKVGGINGIPEEIRVTQHTLVKLIGRDFYMKIRLQPISDDMPADGMLGMQFLKKCTLILSWTRGAVLCP